MRMSEHDSRALELLVSNDYINNERGYNIFYRYLQWCDPNAGEPMSDVFDLVINYFKPEGLFLETLTKQQQKTLMLYILSKGDKDKNLEEYLEKLTAIDKEADKTESELKHTEAVFENFEDDMFEVNEEPSYGVVFSYAVGKQERPPEESLNENEDEDESKGKGKGKGAKARRARKVMRWRINDTVTGETKEGKMLLNEFSDGRAESSSVLGTYMAERPRLLAERKKALLAEMRGKNKELGGLLDDKHYTQSSMGNYEDLKKMIDGRVENRRYVRVLKMRNNLRKQYYEKRNERHKAPQA